MENQPDPTPADDSAADGPPVDAEGRGMLDEPTLLPQSLEPVEGASSDPASAAANGSGKKGDTSVADLDGPTLKPLSPGGPGPGIPVPTDGGPAVVPVTEDISPGSSATNQSLPRPFGDYELIEEIARGGMGVVFRARQRQLNRVVAIKMILTGQLARDEDIARFYTEAEAAASLDHPGIVPIYEVGCHDGQHFFSMGYVEGPSLAQLILERPLEPEVAAELCRQVAVSVGYAHGRGVIHRDLKPANVLVARDESGLREPIESSGVLGGGSLSPWRTSSSNSAASCGVAKVTDFGLAKNVEQQSELTATGQILGTPGYMPPEQAAGRLEDVNAVADVYSVGGILYALLTGRAPFQAATPLDTLMQVLEREPVAPRQLNAGVPADLETICLKCLQKDPKRRYDSAADLVDDLTRFLEGEPIEARPVTRLERGWRWAKRHPAVATLATTTVILIGIIATIAPLVALEQSQLRVAEQTARIEAVQVSEDLAQANDDAEANLYAARVKLAFQHFQDGSLPQMRKTLNEAPTSHRSWEWDFVSGLNGAGRLVLRGHPGEVKQVRFLPSSTDGSQPPQLLTVGKQLNGQLWDLNTGFPGSRFQMITKNEVLDSLGRYSSNFIDSTALVFDHQAMRVTHRFAITGAPVIVTAMSPDGGRIATLRKCAMDEYCLHLYDVQSGALLGGPWVLDPILEPTLVFDADGDRLAMADRDIAAKTQTPVRVWIHSDDDQWRLAELTSEATPTAVAWADDESGAERLMIGDGRGMIRMYDVPDGAGVPLKSPAAVPAVETTLKTPILTLSGSGAGIVCLAFDPVSGRLAAACEDRRVAVWDDFASTSRSLLCGLGDRPMDLRLAEGGRYLAAGSGFGTAIWKLPPPGTLPLRQEAQQVTVSSRPLGDMVSTESGDVYALDRAGRVIRLDSATNEPTETDLHRWLTGERVIAGTPPPERDETIPGRLAISPDGRLLALSVSRYVDANTGSSVRSIRSSVVLWDMRSRRPAGVLGEQNNVITGISFSPTGDRIATVSGVPEATQRAIERDDRMGSSVSMDENDVRIWDVTSGQILVSGRERANSFTAVYWLADDSRLMAASKDRNLESLDVTDLSVKREIIMPVSLRAEDMVAVPGRQDVSSLDENTEAETFIAVGFTDGQIRLYDVETGELSVALIGHADAVQTLHYDAKIQRLFSGGRDATVRVWEPGRALEVLMLPNEGTPVSDVRLTSDRRLLATAADGAIRIWNPQRVATAGPGETKRWLSLADAKSIDLSESQVAGDSGETQPGMGEAQSGTGEMSSPWYREENWQTSIGDWTIEPGRIAAVTTSAGSRQGDMELALARAELKGLVMPDTQSLRMRLRVDAGLALQIHFRKPGQQEGEIVELQSGLNPFSQRQGIRVYAMSDLITARETTANSSVRLSPGTFHDIELWRLPGELIVAVDGKLALVSPQPTVPEAALMLQPMYGPVGGEMVIEDLEMRSPSDAIKRKEVAREVREMRDRWLLTDRVDREITRRSDWSIELKRYARCRLAEHPNAIEVIGKRLDEFLVNRRRELSENASSAERSAEPDSSGDPVFVEDPQWMIALAKWRVERDPSAENLQTLSDVLYLLDQKTEAVEELRKAVKKERTRSGSVSTESLWSLAVLEREAGRTDIATAAAKRALKVERIEEASSEVIVPASENDVSRSAFYRTLALEQFADLESKVDSGLPSQALLEASLVPWLAIRKGESEERLGAVADESLQVNWRINGEPGGGYSLGLDALMRRLKFERQEGAAEINRTVLIEDYEVATRGVLGAVRATVAVQFKHGHEKYQWSFRLRQEKDRWRLLSIDERLLARSSVDQVITWDEERVALDRELLAEEDEMADSVGMLRQQIKIALDLLDLPLAESLFGELLQRSEAIADDWLGAGLVQMRLGKVDQAEASVLRAVEMNSSLRGPPLVSAIRDANSDGVKTQSIGPGLSAEIPSGWRRAGREAFMVQGDFLSGWYLSGNTAMLVMRVPQKATPEMIRGQMKQLGESSDRDVLKIEDRQVGELDSVAVTMEGKGNGGMIDGRGPVLTRQFNQFLFREKDVIIVTVVCPSEDWDDIADDISSVLDSLRYDSSAS
ncbi:MAG: serine/threonine-protein kinase [Planctomycetota bacterium]